MTWHVLLPFCIRLHRLVAGLQLQHNDMCIFAGLQWDRIEDKYAVTTLGVAATLSMWGAGGVVSVLNRHLFLYGSDEGGF